ncbi:hypothetical protein [Lewinella sp. JB7]|uniref:hypothetical protein n=1 Tax=Lewinella sp. JB7 TaxID=2962887 RepID=UPI0020CA112C|nr:hypothetical protein [Lewinella sp. JB7]MCP9235529.1 hypothetical protein [Lewinella sp. JB7]
MFRLITACLLAVSFVGCMESGDEPASQTIVAPAPPPQDAVAAVGERTFRAGERIGLIKAGMPMAKIENLYGSGVLESRKIELGEGETAPGYVLFPGTTDELLIELGDDKQPATARFSNDRSNWREESTGLTIGTTLAELHRMNGRPFTFTGFGWDYGGTVTDWNGGKLDGILVRLTYAPERLPAGGLDPQLLGDVAVSSEADAVRDIGLKVREIQIPIRKPEAVVR